MAATNNKLMILVFLICLLPHILFSSASAEDNDTEAYVDSLCQITKYQDRCVQSLSTYHVSSRDKQDRIEALILLLKKSLTQAIDTLQFLEKLLGNLGDVCSVAIPKLIAPLRGIVSELNTILSVLCGLDGVGSKKVSLQRLTSSALTDAETLVSKFEGRKLSKLEATIYEKVKNVEETTSNALSLIQHYAAAKQAQSSTP